MSESDSTPLLQVHPYEYKRWCGVRRSSCLFFLYLAAYAAYIVVGSLAFALIETPCLEEESSRPETGWTFGQSILFVVTVITTIGKQLVERDPSTTVLLSRIWPNISAIHVWTSLLYPLRSRWDPVHPGISVSLRSTSTRPHTLYPGCPFPDKLGPEDVPIWHQAYTLVIPLRGLLLLVRDVTNPGLLDARRRLDLHRFCLLRFLLVYNDWSWRSGSWRNFAAVSQQRAVQSCCCKYKITATKFTAFDRPLSFSIFALELGICILDPVCVLRYSAIEPRTETGQASRHLLRRKQK